VSYASPVKAENDNYRIVRNEFKTGDFSRSFSLNDKVDAEGIAARYEDGLLKVLLPKKAPLKPEVQQIAVQ